MSQRLWTGGGWTAVAALAQTVAAGATLGTLWFFWLQLKGVRDQARKDFELAHTPLVSVTITKTETSQDGLDVWFRINADGQGPAYNIIVSILREDAPQVIHAQPAVFAYLRAPSSKEGDIEWHDPELLTWTDPKKARQLKVEVVFTNIFNQPTRFQHTLFLNRYRHVAITDAPTYFDLAGRNVKLGG